MFEGGMNEPGKNREKRKVGPNNPTTRGVRKTFQLLLLYGIFVSVP
jgi:hypothetical protein